jgi:hypothetical protein
MAMGVCIQQAREVVNAGPDVEDFMYCPAAGSVVSKAWIGGLF